MAGHDGGARRRNTIGSRYGQGRYTRTDSWNRGGHDTARLRIALVTSGLDGLMLESRLTDCHSGDGGPPP